MYNLFRFIPTSTVVTYGDKIKFNGVIIKASREFIADNKERFVSADKDELTDYIRTRYPKGTKFRSLVSKKEVYTVENNYFYCFATDITVNHMHGWTLCHEGVWPQVLESIGTTGDGKPYDELDKLFYIRGFILSKENKLVPEVLPVTAKVANKNPDDFPVVFLSEQDALESLDQVMLTTIKK